MLNRLRRFEEPEEPAEPLGETPRETPPERPPIPRRRLAWAVTAVVLLLAVALVASRFDEYLRRTLEAKINQRLQGYSVTLGGAHLNPFGLALTLERAVIRQQAHPEPPVANLRALTASVQWRELLRGHLVANAVFDRPSIHVNLAQLQEENRDQVEVEDRGWQQALQSIYPLNFNLFEVRNGAIVYIDDDPERPLEITQWNLTASDVRNIRSAPGTYPSPIHTEGVLFGSGRAVVDGHADFLAEPYPGIHAIYSMEKVPLDRLRRISSRANLSLQGGVLDSKGEIEYGPAHREARIEDVTVHGLRLDYIHTEATAGAEKERAAEASRVARDDQPDMPVSIARLHLADSVVGYDNRAERPFRIFVDRTDLVLTNLSSGFRQGPAQAKLAGRFMGSGAARATATFREESQGPDFDFNIAVEGAHLPAMNDLLRSYGKLDVAGGTFSFFSEVKVKGTTITGYVKPLIKDVDVYDSKQDKGKPVLKKIYEKIVGGVSHLLENRPRDEVATVVDISGTVEDPNTSIWETIIRLTSNAFVKAILPGFDREFEAAQRG